MSRRWSNLALSGVVLLLAWIPRPSDAQRIERILWNALRFRQQAAFIDDAAEAAGIPLSGFDLSYLWNEFPRGETTSVNAGFQLDLSPVDFVFLEIPYVVADWDEGGVRNGFGDVLLEYQRVFRLSEGAGARVSSLVLSLDVVAPTGNTNRAVGEGAWQAFPSLTGVFEVADETVFAPSIAYLHSFEPVVDRALALGLPPDERVTADVRNLQVSLHLVHAIGERWSVLLSPDFTYDFEASRSTWDVRAGFGIEFSEDFACSVQFSQHVGGPVLAKRSLSVFFSYAF